MHPLRTCRDPHKTSPGRPRRPHVTILDRARRVAHNAAEQLRREWSAEQSSVNQQKGSLV